MVDKAIGRDYGPTSRDHSYESLTMGIMFAAGVDQRPDQAIALPLSHIVLQALLLWSSSCFSVFDTEMMAYR